MLGSIAAVEFIGAPNLRADRFFARRAEAKARVAHASRVLAMAFRRCGLSR
jgi:hypothetical protein